MDRTRMARRLLIAIDAILSLVVLLAGPALCDDAATGTAPEVAAFVGSQTCATCHKAKHVGWMASQHAAAMQVATPSTVLGHFDGSTLLKEGIETTFFKRDDKFFVRTDGPDGTLQDFEIAYTFGVYPLQQYLVAFPGGRMQALGIAWDARPADQGGQRWYNLYPDRPLKAGTPLHWTGIDQNWNFQCAFCHSTNLQKNYNPTSAEFKTTWSEINVGCEACHGPASQHLAWAAAKDGTGKPSPVLNKGFARGLHERAGVSWSSGANGKPIRSEPRSSTAEIEVCAKCHARRAQFADAAERSFYESFRPAGLDPGLYYSDGQQRDEVYTFGSFLQSRMFSAGVTCSDCHDPHNGKLRQEKNAVCTQCHASQTYDVKAHHHHQVASDGAQCVSCHMPTTVYMGVDARHDHSFRIPRPDRTTTLGTPNACNQCHKDKSAKWASETLRTWWPQPNPGFQTFAEAFDIGDRMAPGADVELANVVNSTGLSAIVRASALQRLRQFPSPQILDLAKVNLNSADPVLQSAAIAVVGDANPETRASLLPPLLRSQWKLVRMDAARALAGIALASQSDRDSWTKALDEYIAGQLFDAERPEAQVNLGSLYRELGQTSQARAALQTALHLDPSFVAAAIGLAEIESSEKGDEAAERILRDHLKLNPKSGALMHALGLTLVRLKRADEAMTYLQDATQAAPDDSRFAYVLAVAYHDRGQLDAALSTLQKALVHAPFDRDILLTLAQFEIESGDVANARRHLQLLHQLVPAWSAVESLLLKLPKDAPEQRQ